MLTITFASLFFAGYLGAQASIDPKSLAQRAPHVLFIGLVLLVGGVGLAVVSVIESKPFWFGVAFMFWLSVGMESARKAKKS